MSQLMALRVLGLFASLISCNIASYPSPSSKSHSAQIPMPTHSFSFRLPGLLGSDPSAGYRSLAMILREGHLCIQLRLSSGRDWRNMTLQIIWRRLGRALWVASQIRMTSELTGLTYSMQFLGPLLQTFEILTSAPYWLYSSVICTSRMTCCQTWLTSNPFHLPEFLALIYIRVQLEMCPQEIEPPKQYFAYSSHQSSGS